MKMPAITIDVNLFWQIINFFVIVFIFKWKFFGPISKIISERKDLIEKDIENAKLSKENAEKAILDAQAELKKAKAEAMKILIESEKKSEERSEAILKDAHVQREKMIKSGEAEVEKMKESAIRDLEKYTREIAADLTEKLISDKTSSTLIDEAIGKVGEE